MGEGRRIFECPLLQLTQLSPSPQGDPMVLWKLWGRGQVWEGMRRWLPGLGRRGEPWAGLIRPSVQSVAPGTACAGPLPVCSLWL